MPSEGTAALVLQEQDGFPMEALLAGRADRDEFRLVAPDYDGQPVVIARCDFFIEEMLPILCADLPPAGDAPQEKQPNFGPRLQTGETSRRGEAGTP
jgi:hypothetical protein